MIREMSKGLIFLLLLVPLLLPGTTWSQPVPEAEKVIAAEENYRTGDYEAAIAAYEGFINSDWSSGTIFYNLGNCYYKTGEYGKAILNYERARQLLGSDSDLLVNLRLANLHISDRIEPLPRFFILRILEGIGAALPVQRWAVLFLTAEWVLAVVLVSLYSVHKLRWRRVLVPAFVAALVVLIVSGGYFVQQKIYRDNLTEAVVLAEDVTVHSAPESDSTKLFTLHEGVKMRILRSVSGWSEIHLTDGKRGWMPDSAFEII